MGGPAGAGPKLNLADAELGNVYRADDFYQASACVNCHESIPENSCNSCHSVKPYSHSSFLLRPSPCNAELRWPVFLQEAIPHIQQHPWWVQRNHLSAEINKEGNPITTDKISFGIEIFLRAKQSLEISDYRIETQNHSRVLFKPQLAGKSENLSILLEGQNLLELQGILVSPNQWYAGLLPNNWLQEVGVKDGQLFLRAAIGALNLFRNINNPAYSDINLQEFLLPALPIAYHSESGEIFYGRDYEKIKTTDDPLIITIPSTYEIYETRQLPPLLKFSEIFQLLQIFGKISEIKKNQARPIEEKSPLSDLVSSVIIKLDAIPDEIRYSDFYAQFHSEPNSNLSLTIESKGLTEILNLRAEGLIRLKELFIPQILHLGESQAELNLAYQAGKETSLHLGSVRLIVSNDLQSTGGVQYVGHGNHQD